jgi:hypothetical protein
MGMQVRIALAGHPGHRHPDLLRRRGAHCRAFFGVRATVNHMP